MSLWRKFLGGGSEPMSGVPTVICPGCRKTYRIGDDAVAVAVEYAYGLVSKTVILSDGTAPDREDLIAVLNADPKSLESAREKARQNWKIIQESLSRGERRTWRCRACDSVNTYSISTPLAVSSREPTAGSVRINPKDGAEMVYVPAGPFLMGEQDIRNNPRRTLTLDAFWIYKYEVTVAQYRKFC